MQYNGGKYRVAKELAAVISMFNPKVYWEPFVGAGNVIQYVNAPVKIGSDLDIHIVSYLESVRDGWLPPTEISEVEYQFYKLYEPRTRECYATKAAVGYGCSFGGKFFGGFARDPRKARNFARTTHDHARKQSPALKGIDFRNQSYIEFVPAGVNVIYCDPPYAGTTECGSRRHFDSELFWAWCRAMVLTGVTVLVTEFAAPPFALEIWNREKFTDLRRADGNKVMTERLFMVTA